MKLVHYKKTYQKIAMGFLSYISDDYSVKQLQEIMTRYEVEENWELRVVKEQEDLIGIVGIEIVEDYFVVHHVSLNPSYRGEGFGREIILQLQEEYPDKIPYGTEYTEAFVKKCATEKQRAER